MCACFPCKRAGSRLNCCTEKTTGNHFMDKLYIKDYMHISQQLLAVIFWGGCFDAAGLVTVSTSKNWIISFDHSSIQTGIFVRGAFPGSCPNAALLCAHETFGISSRRGVFFVSHSRGWGMILLKRNVWGFFFPPLLSELRIHLTILGWVFGSLYIRNP